MGIHPYLKTRLSSFPSLKSPPISPKKCSFRLHWKTIGGNFDRQEWKKIQNYGEIAFELLLRFLGDNFYSNITEKKMTNFKEKSSVENELSNSDVCQVYILHQWEFSRGFLRVICGQPTTSLNFVAASLNPPIHDIRGRCSLLVQWHNKAMDEKKGFPNVMDLLLWLQTVSRTIWV